MINAFFTVRCQYCIFVGENILFTQHFRIFVFDDFYPIFVLFLQVCYRLLLLRKEKSVKNKILAGGCSGSNRFRFCARYISPTFSHFPLKKSVLTRHFPEKRCQDEKLQFLQGVQTQRKFANMACQNMLLICE